MSGFSDDELKNIRELLRVATRLVELVEEHERRKMVVEDRKKILREFIGLYIPLALFLVWAFGDNVRTWLTGLLT